jgi:hypothetical protein
MEIELKSELRASGRVLTGTTSRSDVDREVVVGAVGAFDVGLTIGVRQLANGSGWCGRVAQLLKGIELLIPLPCASAA